MCCQIEQKKNAGSWISLIETKPTKNRSCSDPTEREELDVLYSKLYTFLGFLANVLYIVMLYLVEYLC